MGRRTNTAKWLENQKRWQIKVQKDGERRTFTSSTPGRTGQREANRKADEWLDEGVSDTGTRLFVLYLEFIAEKKQTTSQSNWRQIESNWKCWIEPAIGKRRIGDITEHDLQKAVNCALTKGLSKKSLKNILDQEKAFIKFCRKKKCCTLFPENVVIPKSARNKGKKILQPHDVIKVFNCTNTTYRGKEVFDTYVYAYRLSVSTGLRPGELIGLRWRDVKGSRLHVTRSINQFGEVTTGKNENAIRCINLNATELELLGSQKELTSDTTSDSIFEITTLQGYEKRWERFRLHNGISKVSPYELRHTFVSMHKKLPAGLLKGVVGHSRDMDTFGVYGHKVDGEGTEIAEARENVLLDILKQVEK